MGILSKIFLKDKKEELRGVPRKNTQKHSNLVVVRSKDPEKVYSWITQDRNWDLMILDYSSGGVVDFINATIIRQPNASLRKFDGIYAAVQCEYDYYLLIDDDLELIHGDIADAFDIAKQEDFWICQPSLTADSACSWSIVYSLPSLKFRDVAFVEVMMPILSRNAFLELREKFLEVPIGLGLDIYWSALALKNRKKLGIIDKVAFRHARPPGSGDIYEGHGKGLAEQSMMKFLDTNNLKFEVSMKILGGELGNGQRDFNKITLAALRDMFELGGFNGIHQQHLEMIAGLLDNVNI